MSPSSRSRRKNSEPELLGFNRRKAIVTLVAAVVLGAAAITAIGHAADFGKLSAAIRKADQRWLPLCLFGQVLAYGGYILAYRDVARADGGPVLDYWKVTRIVAIGLGAFVVGSTPGGLAVDFWALRRAGAGRHESARRVLALNTLEWAVLASFAALASIPALLGRGRGAPAAMTLSWLVCVPVCGTAAAWVSSPRRIERLTRIPDDEPSQRGRDLGAWWRWLAVKLRKAFADAVGGVCLVRHIVSHPRRYPAGVLGYPLYWLGQLVTLYAAVQAFAGGPLVPSALILAFATGYVASALPLPAGGAGGIEASIALTLHLVGVPLAPALLAAVTYRLFTFWLPIVPSLLFLPSARALNDELPAVGREEPAAARS